MDYSYFAYGLCGILVVLMGIGYLNAQSTIKTLQNQPKPTQPQVVVNKQETDSKLLLELKEQVESFDRRITTISADVNRHLQKASIRLRRAAQLEGLDDEEEEEEVSQDQINQAVASLNQQPQPPNGTPETDYESDMLDQIRAHVQQRRA